MKRFLGKNFLLETDTARELYHDVAADLPICDFHCHIPVQQIAENKPYTSISQVWLHADHYKWRAMRYAGVPEALITGNASDEEKFLAWAETVPGLIGNPLYHWTHLELKRYFDISEPLSPKTAVEIWNECNHQLSGLHPQDIIAMSNVRLLCTTDDPVDSLDWHQRLQVAGTLGAVVLPAFRPDRALAIESDGFASWMAQLECVVGFAIHNYETFKRALSLRMEFFHANGCRLSDHALDRIPEAEYSEALAQEAFAAFRRGDAIPAHLLAPYKVALLCYLAAENSRLGWTMQLHIGALRNVNPAMQEALGPDAGFDCADDAPIAGPLVHLLGAMQQVTPLPRLLLFGIHEKDTLPLLTIAGAMQRDGIPLGTGIGPAWWFLDQQDGIRRQLRQVASTSPLSEFVGMTTDSRSLLSYARHEYFRRILCNQLGSWVESGEYPQDYKTLTQIIRRICYENAMSMFEGVSG